VPAVDLAGLIFFPVQPPGEAATPRRPRRSVSSIRHPRLFLSSSSLPGRVSHFVTLHESSIPLSIGPACTSGSHVHIIDDTYTCSGRPTRRFTHALIRGFHGGWWEEADARRRGARTWCAKIYGTGVYWCAKIHFTYKHRTRARAWSLVTRG